jgi:predicted transposase YdaD
MESWQERWKENWKQGWLEGWREGREEALRSTAKNLIQTTELSDRAIADATGLALGDVQAMRDELQH